MKVTIGKNFGDLKKGESVEVTKERAAYWELVGVTGKEAKKEETKVPVKAVEKVAPTKAPVKVAPKAVTTQTIKKK